MSKEDLIRDAQRLLAFDEAIAKLHEAGLEEEFIKAIEKDPAMLKALDKMAPSLTAAASPGWSCCITVNRPLAEYRALR